MDVKSDLCVCPAERDACNLLAYDELRELGVAAVFRTAEQPGFCSDTGSESEGE
jgi:hypothetical protein